MRKNTSFIVIIFWMIFGLSIWMYAGEGQAAEGDAEMQKLMGQLGDNDFDTRDFAMRRLIEIGEPVWPLLEKACDSEDAEVRLRARLIAKETGMILPALKKIVEPLLEKLKSRNDDERCKALDEVLKIIPAYSLKKILSAAPGKLEMSFIAPPLITSTVGAKLEFKVKVTNIDTKPFWIAKSAVNKYYPSYDTHLDIKKTNCGPHISETGGGGGRGRVWGDGRMRLMGKVVLPNPLKDFILLAPGESIEGAVNSASPDELFMKVTAIGFYKSGKSAVVESLKKWENDSPNNKGYIETYDLLNPFNGTVSATYYVQALEFPKTDKGNTQPVNGLKIITDFEKAQFNAGEVIKFAVSFTNTANEIIKLTKHEKYGYPLWAVIENKGNVLVGAVGNGGFSETWFTMMDNEFEAVELMPGETICEPVAIDNFKKGAGDYKITVGYRADMGEIKLLKETGTGESGEFYGTEEKVSIWKGEAIGNTTVFEIIEGSGGK